MKICIATWNIRRGLIKHEEELKGMLYNENIDIIVLTETDLKNMDRLQPITIENFMTYLPLQEAEDAKIRIMALVRKELTHSLKLREDLMDPKFPTVWLEWEAKNKKKNTVLWPV